MGRKALGILLLFSLFGGCSNKLNLLAPYKESVSVYGLLNAADTIHYIRVERVFLGAGNAYIMAQNQDSVYFKSGELTVSLQRWNIYTGTQVSVDSGATATAMQIVLTDTLIQLDAGTFNTNARVYKTNHKLYASDTNTVYKLIIQNNITGKQYTSQTSMVANFQLTPVIGNVLSPFWYASTPADIIPGGQNKVVCQYNSPVNSGVCSLTMRLFYTEYGNTTTSKYVDLGLGTSYPVNTFGNQLQVFDYSSASLLSEIESSIPVDLTVNQRTANYVDFLLSAGGPDLALYNEVNSATPLSQSTPNYSNISGGIGVFSSRYQISLKRFILSTPCLDTLAGSPVTCNLKFTNSSGNLTPCH